MMIFVFLFALCASIATVASRSGGYIVVLGDVQKDVEFFTRTFPWIIDNIGGDVVVEFFMLGSGRYSVPQSCALTLLYANAFLQAQYLRCEANGYPGEYCLCEAGVDPENFKRCVGHGGYIAGQASERYSSYNINESPLIDIGDGTVLYGLDDISLLKKICTHFGDNPPRGCIHPSDQADSFLEKKALAQFDRACRKEFPFDENKPEVVTTTEKPWFTTETERTAF
ncbi:hypothetical protein PYW08_006518 [Mythimna loreyi]|uniref:Uncharacterized protein n=1 Tax=Mythimna loreyi TaxID=667449 RepID=A0ACC2QT08_9NEOP|nr:hypothetical protein PYW08_006518 [Mythimna loreyi]